MSLRTFEREILNEARIFLVNPNLKLKDLLEWQTGTCNAKSSDEKVIELKLIGVSICVLAVHDKRQAVAK